MTPPATLARRLNLTDAVVIGLGAMIGAGVFAAPGPAAAAAGTWVLAGLAIAAVVAYANATSSAQLAALYPEAGGTYVYARERLGNYWGFLAGWSFVVGKTASLVAMALTVAASLLGGHADAARLETDAPAGIWGVLQSGGLLFFAFAGYTRLATLGEEVIDPETTIPRAIPIALGIVVVVYAIVLASALLAVGPQTLADTPAPLAAAVEAGRWRALSPIVRVGAAVAAAGVLLSLLAGISRTALSMARRRELPGFLDAVHPVHRTPHRAEITAAALVIAVVLIADLRGVIGFSSFAILTYYALANASAWTLTRAETRWPRWLAALGVMLCAVLSFTLPPVAGAGGIILLGSGSAVWLASGRRRTQYQPPR